MPPRRSMGLKRPHPIDVKVDDLEDEFVSRESYQRKMSRAAFLRTGRIPPDRAELQTQVLTLRRIQKGKTGILRNKQ